MNGIFVIIFPDTEILSPESQPTSSNNNPNNKNASSDFSTGTSTSSLGQIRVKPIENLFENYKEKAENHSLIQPIQQHENMLEDFNLNKTSHETETLVIPLNDGRIRPIDQEKEYDCPMITIEEPQLPPSLRYNSQVMDISVTPFSISASRNVSLSSKKVRRENGPQTIMCTPSMDDLSSSIDCLQQNGDTEDMFYDETALFEPNNDDDDIGHEFQSYIPLSNFSQIQNKSKLPKLLPKPQFFGNPNNKNVRNNKTALLKPLLRSPRGNQSRTYTEKELINALNEVKAGVSIYKAAQKYRVPRKTLRNWMQRWKIKSAYPMPAQLQRAAEKRREERDQILASICVSNDSQTHVITDLVSDND